MSAVNTKGAVIIGDSTVVKNYWFITDGKFFVHSHCFMNNTLAINKLLKALEQEKENFQQQIDDLKSQGMIVIIRDKIVTCTLNFFLTAAALGITYTFFLFLLTGLISNLSSENSLLAKYSRNHSFSQTPALALALASALHSIKIA